jgi:hypothetical protein
MAVAGVVLLGILYAMGSWGVCCGPAISKPITGDATWAKPSNPSIFGQAPAPAKKADHGAKANEGASGASANPVGTLAALKPHTQGPSQPSGAIPTGDTGQSESPLPPSGGSGNATPTNNCSPVLDVLAGLGVADCAPEAGTSDHNDSSDNHGSSGNGNHHSSNQGDSSGNANADATLQANLPAAANDQSNGSDHGNHNGSDNGKKDHGASSQAKSHGNKHH